MTTPAEPTYHFVKGQGWVPLGADPKVGYIVDRHGRKWKVTEVIGPVEGMIWDATIGYGQKEPFRKVVNNFQEYLAMRNGTCLPDAWSKWAAFYSKTYNIYFMYEEVV